MTSMAFGLGVLPLAVATGVGAGAEHAIGTGVFGGMLGGTFLGIFFIPLFFMIVPRLLHRVPATLTATSAADTTAPGAGSPESTPYGPVYSGPAGHSRH